MSLDTYANLKTELADKVARSDITSASSIIDTAIDLLEAEANSNLRLYPMLSTTTLSTTGGVETVSLPADFVQFYSMYISTDPSPLKMDTESNIRARFQRGLIGRPSVYALYPENQCLLAPVPDSSTYTLDLQYYAKLPALSDANTTNWLLTMSPGYYYYGALRHLFMYITDPETQAMVESAFNGVQSGLISANSKKLTIGGGMMAHVIGQTP